MKNKITALYARTAQPNQEKIFRQHNMLISYANSQGFKSLQHYTDDGFAGTDAERPAYKKLMEDVRTGIIGIIIVNNLARLTRNMTIYGQIKNELALHGVRLIALEEKIDLISPTVFDETTGTRYDLCGDYYFPNLLDPEQENTEPIGKWGLMHRKYLEEHHPGQYAHLLLSGRLMDRLREIDKQATERFDTLMDGYSKEWNITEALKADDPIRWVQLMNNAKSEAEWNVTREIVCY